MNSYQQPSASYLPTASAPATLVAAGGEFAPFDGALHAAAVREAAAMPEGAPLMAAGGWSAVLAPEDPRALELRHLRGLPAADAARIRELFAEVVDAGGACQGDAWEVLHLWRLGSSPSAVAAANAVMILVCRAVEAELAAEETAACPPRP